MTRSIRQTEDACQQNQMPCETRVAALSWDLHCHTVFSDGTCTPTSLVLQACELGLQGVAICDHDTSAGWEEFHTAAVQANLPVLYGTEITAQANKGATSVHVLAYQYDPLDPVIMQLFASTRQARLQRTRRMVEALSADYPITWQSVIDQANKGEQTTIGRPHIADALVALGVYRERSEAFAHAVSVHSPYYIPTPSPDVHEVIDAIKHAGGVSVIAHLGDRQRNETLLRDEQIADLVKEGLDGLEVYHRGNQPDQRDRLLRLANQHQLLVTGGSDWHGNGKPNRLAENTTDYATVMKIIERGNHYNG